MPGPEDHSIELSNLWDYMVDRFSRQSMKFKIERFFLYLWDLETSTQSFGLAK